MIRTEDLNQIATYWAPGEPDGTGGYEYAPSVPIKCRWQDTQTILRNAAGRSVASEHTVYVDRVLEMNGYLVLGAVDDAAASPLDVPLSKLILKVYTTQDLDNTETLIRAML